MKFLMEFKREISIFIIGQILLFGVMAFSGYYMWGALGLGFYLIIGSLITGKLWFSSFKSATIIIIWPIYIIGAIIYVLIKDRKEIFCQRMEG